MDAAERAGIDAWLGHRPKDRRGLPIPYVNRWGPETAETTRLRFDRNVGMAGVFVDDVGDEVDFTRQNFQRQRECMVRGLCQVCGRFVPWSRRLVPVAPFSVDMVTVEGVAGQVAAVFEPWLDERCAAIAQRWCPALIRRRREEQLLMHPVRSRREVQMLMSVGSVDAFPQTLVEPVAMWAKLALLTLNITVKDKAVRQ